MTRLQEQYLNSVNLNAQSDFPYLVLHVINDQSYPRNLGFQVMHWHEDLQCILVLDGSITVRTLDQALPLGQGEGCLIGKDVVYLVEHAGPCRYNSFLFPETFLSFYPGSPANRFVSPLAHKLELCRFSPGTEGQLLDVLRQLGDLEQHKPAYYEYQVLVLLSTLWLELLRLHPLPAQEPSPASHARPRAFLQYIQEHYAEEVSLEQLAASAHVSKSECLRCFQRSLQTTPYRYLLEYRLAVAARLLREGDDPIGSIASQVGFHQMSHFGRCFRRKTGLSPKEYRRNHRQAGSLDW